MARPTSVFVDSESKNLEWLHNVMEEKGFVRVRIAGVTPAKFTQMNLYTCDHCKGYVYYQRVVESTFTFNRLGTTDVVYFYFRLGKDAILFKLKFQ
jgi:hypothetical protein